MKNIMMNIVVAGLLLAAPATAQDFNSTSTMQGSGSSYASQVSPVGATAPQQMSTVGSPSQVSGRRNSDFGDNQDAGYKDTNSPIGDAVLPLLLLTAAFGGGVYLRRRGMVR